MSAYMVCMYRMLDVVQPKVSIFVASLLSLHSARKSWRIMSLCIPPILHRLALSHDKVTAFIRKDEEAVGILAGLNVRVDQVLVARPAIYGLLGAAAIGLDQNLPSGLIVPRSAFWQLTLKLLNGLLAEPDAVRNSALQRPRFACFHIRASYDMGCHSVSRARSGL